MENSRDIKLLVTAACGSDQEQAAAAIDALQKLGDNSWRYEMAAGSLPDVVFYETGGGREYVSDSLVAILGYPPEKFTEDRNFFVSLMHEDDIPATETKIAEWHEAGETEMLILQFRARHADGSWVWFEDRMVQIQPPWGDKPYMFGVMVEMTRRRTAELALIEAEKKIAGNKALQIAARTFAHHINNPLTGILGNCQILSDELEGREELREIIAEIRASARQIAEVTQKLLAETEPKYRKYLDNSEIFDV